MAKRTQSSRRAGAARSPEMPGFIKPQLATLKSKAPAGPQWLHEIKFDGYRVQVHLNKGKRKVYTRNGLDWTKRFSQIAGALDVPGQAIIDGEVVVTWAKSAPVGLGRSQVKSESSLILWSVRSRS
jgi:ATP-dependent DNA ligase